MLSPADAVPQVSASAVENGSPRVPEGAPAIHVVGLGPGDWSLLTIGALERLQAADLILLRTRVHPTVAPLQSRLRPEQQLRSFDDHYEHAVTFEELYLSIVSSLLDEALAASQPIVYAVPGHPLVGERTVTLLLARASRLGVAIHVTDGVSFLEPLASALALDPLASGLQLFDGAAVLEMADATFAGLWQDLSPRILATGRPLVLGQVYDRRVASACKLWLLERYPPDHQLLVVTAAGAGTPRLRTVPLGDLDHSAAFDHLTSVFVPALDPLLDTRGLLTLPYIAARLRAPDGCPWDREQTIQSLKPHLLEEAHEAAAALDSGDAEAIAEELGDVLLLVTMIAGIAEEDALLDLPHILETGITKLIRRHPHVFGDVRLVGAEAVLQNWERIKAGERAQSGERASASVLDGVPASMPALIAAQVIGRKAAALGFDWPDISGVWAKVREEITELESAATENDRLEEMGDLFFALVNLCRHQGLDAEEALRRANGKFRVRFQQVERLCAERGLDMQAMDITALDVLWDEAKAGAGLSL